MSLQKGNIFYLFNCLPSQKNFGNLPPIATETKRFNGSDT
jgi:hypothetical protein